MVVNNFIQPYYGASYGMNPYAGYSPYGMSNPYSASPYGMNGSYGGLPNTGYSPYGYNPMQSTYAGIQSLANGANMIVQALASLRNNRSNDGATQGSANQNKATQAKAADDQWQKCGCSKS